MARAKMTRQDRAKQFMPFAALKGYEDALRLREKIVVEQMELSEERKEELDRVLRQVKKLDMVEVVYYNGEEYLKVQGLVSRLDVDARILTVVNTKIPFDMLYDIGVY